MNPSAEQIQKINHFSKVHIDMCAKIASVVEIDECGPKKQLLTEGDTGDTMVLVFQGQVEVSKNMMVKTGSSSLLRIQNYLTTLFYQLLWIIKELSGLEPMKEWLNLMVTNGQYTMVVNQKLQNTLQLTLIIIYGSEIIRRLK